MVVWIPQERTELRRLYDMCRCAGAPLFHSEEEMHEWLRSVLEKIRTDATLVWSRLLTAVREAKVDSLLKLVRKIEAKVFRDLLRKQLVFKALHKPIQLIPQSLHPNESVA